MSVAGATQGRHAGSLAYRPAEGPSGLWTLPGLAGKPGWVWWTAPRDRRRETMMRMPETDGRASVGWMSGTRACVDE